MNGHDKDKKSLSWIRAQEEEMSAKKIVNSANGKGEKGATGFTEHSFQTVLGTSRWRN